MYFCAMKRPEVHPEAKALIFDLDGTLVDSMPLHYKAWKEVLSTQGIDFSEDEFYAFAGIPAETIFGLLNEKYGTTFDPGPMTRIKEQLYLDNLSEIRKIDVVVEIAENYYGKLPMAIGTGSPKKDSLKVVQMLGMEHLFEILISKNDVSKGKPHPETFLKCAEHLGIEPQFCQVFEDGDPGIVAAKEAGMFYTDVRLFL